MLPIPKRSRQDENNNPFETPLSQINDNKRRRVHEGSPRLSSPSQVTSTPTNLAYRNDSQTSAIQQAAPPPSNNRKETLNEYLRRKFPVMEFKKIKATLKQTNILRSINLANDYYYVGAQKLQLPYLNTIDLAKYDVSVYISTFKSTILARSHKTFYLMFVNKTDSTDFSIQNLDQVVELKEKFVKLLNLFIRNKCDLVVSSIEHLFDFQVSILSIDVYLIVKSVNLMSTNNLSCSDLKYDDPTDMHLLVSQFLVQDKNVKSQLIQIAKNKYFNSSENSINSEMDVDLEEDANLFDLIHQIHQKESAKTGSNVGNQVIQRISSLAPKLRPYQINAIKWMLNKERFVFGQSSCSKSHDELHPLYLELKNSRDETIYYHKYYGLFCKNKPLKEESIKGGILADEMGLGKT